MWVISLHLINPQVLNGFVFLYREAILSLLVGSQFGVLDVSKTSPIQLNCPIYSIPSLQQRRDAKRI